MCSPACGSDDILRYNGRLSAICKLGNWPSIQLKCIGQVGDLGVGLSGQVGGGSQWSGWRWVSVAGVGVGLSGRGGVGGWVSVVGMGWVSGQDEGGSRWYGWGWVSVVRVGVGLRVRMGWVSVVGMVWVSLSRVGMGWVSLSRVGMGWVSLSRVGMGWVCGQDGEGLSRRDGVGLLYI